MVGLLTGAVAGLATVTPAAGYVTTSEAVLIGIISGASATSPWPSRINSAGTTPGRLGRARSRGDAGVILLGVFASTAANPAGANGLLHGNAPFFIKELLAVAGAGIYAFVFTYAMLWLITRSRPSASVKRTRWVWTRPCTANRPTSSDRFLSGSCF